MTHSFSAHDSSGPRGVGEGGQGGYAPPPRLVKIG